MPAMTPTELETIGRALLPDHSKDRWRKEIGRIADYSDRMVRYWHEEPDKHPIPLTVQKVLRAEYRKLLKRQEKGNHQ